MKDISIFFLLIVLIISGCERNIQTSENTPPQIPTNPYPADNTTQVIAPVELSWLCSDTDGDSLYFDLYVNTGLDSLILQAQDLSVSTFLLAELQSETTYYWQILAKDYQDSTYSPIWSFSSAYYNYPPSPPADPFPAIDAQDQALQLSLNWQCLDPEGNSLHYDLYFGMEQEPGLLALNIQPPYLLLHLHENTNYYWQVVALDDEYEIPGEIWHFRTGDGNFAPFPAYLPRPASGLDDVNIYTTLSWSALDPENDSLTYDLYFGSETIPQLLASSLTDTAYVPGMLDYDTDYNWKIDVSDGEFLTTGFLWSFHTEVLNFPPTEPHSPSPPDEAEEISLSAFLCWECQDPNEDELTYDVYLGIDQNLLLISSIQTENWFYPLELQPLTEYYWKVTACDNEFYVESSIWQFQTAPGNLPPLPPFAPAPDNNSSDVSIYTVLSWLCSDPDDDALLYDVCLGTDPNPEPVSLQQAESTFQPVQLLIPDTQYYWQITASDGEFETVSPIWVFTTSATAQNQPPAAPYSPIPEDGASDIELDIILHWQGSDPDGDQLLYELYFGIESDLQLLAENLSDSSFQPDLLSENTTYNWQVLASDGEFTSQGDIWSFQTHTDSVNFEMVYIPETTYAMGDTHEQGGVHESPVHNVSISAFEISRCEITQQQWQSVMDYIPAQNNGAGDDYPIYNVSWVSALEFCNALSTMHDLNPCYNINGIYSTCDFSANGYRLPTEAEWEWAARGAEDPPDYLYSGSDNIDDVAIYAYNSSAGCAETASKEPNELNLYDLSGNLWEWCWDWYDQYYYDYCNNQGTVYNPTGPETGIFKIIRGGSWFGVASLCRTSCRYTLYPAGSGNTIGFRIVKTTE